MGQATPRTSTKQATIAITAMEIGAHSAKPATLQRTRTHHGPAQPHASKSPRFVVDIASVHPGNPGETSPETGVLALTTGPDWTGRSARSAHSHIVASSSPLALPTRG